MSRLIALGAVMGAHGVRGELRVRPYNDDSVLIFDVERVTLRHGGSEQMHVIESVRPGNKGWLVSLDGIATPEQAKALHGAELCVPRDAFPALAPGEYYFVDLPGLAVVASDGASVGHIERVQQYPASSVLCVSTPGGTLEVPMHERYLVSVDVAQGRVVVDHLEDLEFEKPSR